jgi:hypothetical protein
MGRTEIAGFQPQTYKTLQSDARKTTISQHKINDMGVVQGELSSSIFDHMERHRRSEEVLRCLDVIRHKL